MGFLVGIDVGGTFTDGAVVTEGGEVRVFKAPTVPEEPSLGFISCLERAARAFGLSLPGFLAQVDKLTYGTTLATNLLLEGGTAPTASITTRGFRDTLPMARVGREYLGIDLQAERPPPLVPRRLIFEVGERLDREGRVITPLNRRDVAACLERLCREGVQAVAICLLWSFKNPDHERQLREEVQRALPGAYVSISSEVAPIMGEYERTATVVLNAMLGPPVAAHLHRLVHQLGEKGLSRPLLLMQSTGGVVPAEDASIRPVALVGSGPAGGLVASRYLGELLGIKDIVGVDMGGTSFDASLITDGEYSVSLVSRIRGNSVYVPMLDIHSIGAGGGSIARVDQGRLKVGPKSAGAHPGPACYGRGGVEPTVTDADLVLGHLNPDYFLGGEMPLDVGLAQAAIEARVAQPLGMDLVPAAAGICRIVDAQMADALRTVTIQRGYDPRRYAMIAFGGAGPTHASAIALELDIKTVIVPYLATVQSAFGIVSSDIVHSLSLGAVANLDDRTAIARSYEGLEAEGSRLLDREGIDPTDREFRRFADIRYRMQAHEVTIPVPRRLLGPAELARLVADFERRYEELYGPGTVFRQAGLEIVAFRVEAIGHTRRPQLRRHPEAAPDATPALKANRAVFFDGAFMATNVYDGDKLRPGNRLEGPAVIEYLGTTALVHPHQVARVDSYLNLVLRWIDK